MSCERIQDLLSPYLDGELAPAERAEADEHLAGCSDCAELLARIRAALGAFAAFPEVELNEGLKARLAAIPERTRRRARFSLDVLFKPALQPVLAAATGFLMLFSVYMVSPNKGAINRAISLQLHRGISSIEKLYVKAGSLTDRLGEFANGVFASAKDINPLGRGED
ncbi:MAG: zf-HC2 domain-containing protein [Candidatus Aminicenantales bacterium]|jgi:anti-sigma factor RsiW